MSGKLTPLRHEALRKIGAGEIRQQRFGYAAWRICGASPNAVGWLIARGLAAWGKLDGDRIPCELTPAGRALLTDTQQGADNGSV